MDKSERSENLVKSELLRACESYREIAQVQMGEGE